MSDMSGIMPTVDINGNNNGWGSAGWGAAAGGFIGSAVGNGNGFFGNRNNNGENLVIDTINTNRVSNEIQGVGSSINTLQNATNQGFAGLNTTTLQSISALQNSTNQGFSGLNSAVVGVGKDNQLATCQSTNAIVTAIKDCCCETQKEIITQGNLTREQNLNLYIKGVETALCDSKAEIISLKSDAAVVASNAVQTQTLLAHLTALTAK